MKVWNIVSMEVAPSEDDRVDVVKTVHWTVDYFDDPDTVGAYGSVALDSPGVDFTAYDSLSKESVVEWVKAKLNEGETNVEEIESALDNQMAIKKNPPIVKKPLPW